MPIQMTCPNCARRYALADAAAGKTLRCKGCGKSLKAAGPDANGDEPGPKPKARPAKAGGRALIWGLLGGGAAVLLVLLLVCGGLGFFLLPHRDNGRRPDEEAYPKLTPGMSEKEVVGIMGPPDGGGATWLAMLAEVQEPGTKTLHWQGRSFEYAVELKDGKAVNASCVIREGYTVTPECLPTQKAVPWAGNLTPEGRRENVAARDFRRLTPNMNEMEVAREVGSPTVRLHVHPAFYEAAGLTKADLGHLSSSGFSGITRYAYKVPGQGTVSVIFIESRMYKVTNG
jgi:hypothetical protein